MVNAGFRNTRPSRVRKHLIFHLTPQSLALSSWSLITFDCKCHFLWWMLRPHLHIFLQIQLLFHDPPKYRLLCVALLNPLAVRGSSHIMQQFLSQPWRLATVLYMCPSVPPMWSVFYLPWIVHTALQVVDTGWMFDDWYNKRLHKIKFESCPVCIVIYLIMNTQ